MCIRDSKKYEVEIEKLPDHNAAMELVLQTLTGKEHGVISDLSEIGAVGHRVLHGGEKFTASCLIDDAVIAAIEEYIPLGPLHNPANLMGIRACQKVLPDVPQAVSYTHLDVYKRQAQKAVIDEHARQLVRAERTPGDGAGDGAVHTAGQARDDLARADLLADRGDHAAYHVAGAVPALAAADAEHEVLQHLRALDRVAHLGVERCV